MQRQEAHSEREAILYAKRMEINKKLEDIASRSIEEFKIWEKTNPEPTSKFKLSTALKKDQDDIEQEIEAFKVDEEAHIAESEEFYPLLKSVQGGRRKRGTRKVKRGKKGSRKGMRKGIRR